MRTMTRKGGSAASAFLLTFILLGIYDAFLYAECSVSPSLKVFSRSELNEKMQGYSREDILACRAQWEMLAKSVDAITGSSALKLAQQLDDEAFSILAAVSVDCRQVINVVGNLTFSTRRSNTKREEGNNDNNDNDNLPSNRVPHLHDETLFDPPYVGCSGMGPFADFISPVATDIVIPIIGVTIPAVLDTRPTCQNTGNWDKEAGLHIASQTLTAILYALAAACDASKSACISTLPGIPCIPISAIACGLKTTAEYVKLAIDAWMDMVNTQDAMIADALTHANFENAIVIYEAVSCLNATAPRKHHGCNGADENCDYVADDCAEDTFAPDMLLDLSLLNSAPWFTDVSEAIDFAASLLQSEDDCTPQADIYVTAPSLSGTCDSVTAAMSATDACGNTADVTVPLKIDTSPPTIGCTIGADEIIAVPWRQDDMMDVGFGFSAYDDCSTPTVKVNVYSDTFPLATVGDAYILAAYEGGYQRVLVHTGYRDLGPGRVYTIVATATNAAGLSASCSSTVNVHPKNTDPAVYGGAIFLVASLVVQ